MKKPAKATAVDVVKAATKRVIRVREKPAEPVATPTAEPRKPEENRF